MVHSHTASFGSLHLSPQHPAFCTCITVCRTPIEFTVKFTEVDLSDCSLVPRLSHCVCSVVSSGTRLVRLLRMWEASQDLLLGTWIRKVFHDVSGAGRVLANEPVAHLCVAKQWSYSVWWRAVENRIFSPKVVVSGTHAFLACTGNRESWQAPQVYAFVRLDLSYDAAPTSIRSIIATKSNTVWEYLVSVLWSFPLST